MKLQIAIDNASADTILDTVDKIADIIDIVEVGTPMIIRDGQRAVHLVKEKHPELTVLSDSKIVDGGDWNAVTRSMPGPTSSQCLPWRRMKPSPM